MDETCERIREQLPELIDSGLSPEKAVELEQHRSQCPDCNRYFEALQADDKLLSEFVQGMQPRVTRLENIAIDALGRRKPIEMPRPVPVWVSIARSKTARVAAMVSIAAAVLIGAAVFRGPRNEPVETVRQVSEPDRAPAVAVQSDKPDLDAVIAAELTQIQEMFAAPDVAGLVTMLNEGQPQSKLVAAGYLARIGDARALGALEQLSAAWAGGSTNNPFADAASQIMDRLQQQDQEAEPTENDKVEAVAETAAVRAEDSVGCKGIVVDEQGRAIAGARVLLYHNRSRWGLGNSVVEETTSMADGTFVCWHGIDFSSVNENRQAQDTYVLMATHPDYAFGWWNIRQGAEQDTYRVVLTSPTSRTITVTDNQDNPLAGVWIWLSDAGYRGSPNRALRDELMLATDVGLAGGITDSEGRALITNLPDTYCSFRAALKGYAESFVVPVQTVVELSPGGSISGTVLADVNEPVIGATVSLKPTWWAQQFVTMTDKDGRFHLEGLPAKDWRWGVKGDSESVDGSYTVTIGHERYAAPQTNVTLWPDRSVEDFLIKAHSESTLVECLVLESGTNVPVSGARITGSNEIGDIDGYSDPNGILAIRVLPGLVLLSFRSPPDGVYVLENRRGREYQLRFNATGEKMQVTLRTPPIAGFLRSVSGIVLGPDGITLDGYGTLVCAEAGRFYTSGGGNFTGPVGVDSDGRFELEGVPAGRKLHIYAATKDGTLAGGDVFEIPDDPDWSGYLAVNLRVTQRASVIVRDANGSPVPDRQFRIAPVVEGERISRLSLDLQGSTDENGLLEIDRVVRGLEYHLSSVEPEMVANPSRPSLEATRRQVTSQMVLLPLEPQ